MLTSVYLIWTFFVKYIIVNCAVINKTEVILVHGIFRHGDRTTYVFYPTDPYQNRTFYPIGLGGLTNTGKLREYTLGTILRKEYDQILGKYYTDDLLEVRSTDTSRTINSASLVMAGLWPPVEEQVWNKDLLWQPVQVVSKDFQEEDLLDATYCNFRRFVVQNYNKSEEMNIKFVTPYKILFDYIANHTGAKIENLLDLQSIYFTLKCEDDIGLELPDWTKQVYPEPITTTVSLIYGYLNFDSRVRRIHAGYLLQKIINDSLTKIDNKLEPKERKMFLYSGHDTTLGYILDALKVLEPHVPLYGSIIIFELHQRVHEYFLKLRYLRNPFLSTFEDIRIKGCDDLCPINKFLTLVSDILPVMSYKEACNIGNYPL